MSDRKETTITADTPAGNLFLKVKLSQEQDRS
jgi:hypothetical protein